MQIFLTPLLFVLAATVAMARGQDSDAEIEIREWPVPWENSRPRDPAIAADGRVWFVGQAGDYVAVFDPGSESFARFDLPEGTGPHNLIVTGDQQIWYAGNRAAHLGRLDPGSGTIEPVATPADGAADPHTLIEDSRGRIWFTAQHGNHIGRYDRQSGEIELVGAASDRARPYGIVLDGEDNAWVALFGTNKLARVDAQTFALAEIELPRPDARARRLVLTNTGLYYGDYSKGYLGHVDPGSGEITEWRMPGEDKSGAYAMAADGQGRIWFVETWQNPNRLVGFDPQTERFFARGDIPGGGGAVRHMVFDPKTDSIWFGTDTNHLGQAIIP